MKKTEYVVEHDIGLLDFLREQMPDSSRTAVKELLAHCVYVDGRRISRFDHQLRPGTKVMVERTSKGDRSLPADLDIVFEDRHLLVVNKHAGLLSNSKDPHDRTVITLVNRYLDATRQRCHAHIIHRLDRDTSGLMLVGKSKEVCLRFEQDWKGMVYDRRYAAVVWGQLDQPRGEVRSWLTDGEYCVLSSPTDNGGKLAVTHYEVVRTSRRYSLLDLKLDTGRRNQIRVHMRELKHPVVHDPMYGYRDDISPISRLALHAYRLCFVHPITGKRHKFELPLPSAFDTLMQL